MPRPRNPKIARDSAADCVRAYPRATPMKGAVHGVATTVARTPLRKEPPSPPPESILPPSPTREVPISNTPKRLRPNMKMMTDRITMKAGDWSWKPHPSCSPPARRAIRTDASARKETSTPAVKTSPCRRAFAGSSPAWWMNPSTLMDSTGSTQGMRLRIRPPTRAKSRACHRPDTRSPEPAAAARPEPAAMPPAAGGPMAATAAGSPSA